MYNAATYIIRSLSQFAHMCHEAPELRLHRRFDVWCATVADLLHELERGEVGLLGASGNFGEGLGWRVGVSVKCIRPMT